MPSTTEIKIRIVQVAIAKGVAPLLALAVAKTESNFNPSALSPAGAIGVFQLMPGTAGDLGVDPWNWEENIDGGIRHLAYLLSKYPGRQEFALAAYNWGQGNVNRVLNQSSSTAYPSTTVISSFPINIFLAALPAETSSYIPKVMNNMIVLQNDSALIGAGGGGGDIITPTPSPGVEISDSDIKIIAGVTVGILLIVMLLRK